MPISRLLTALIYVAGAFLTPSVSLEQPCAPQPKPLFLRIGNCTLNSNSDHPNGVQSWGIQVGLGSPMQTLCLEPSLVVNNTVIMANAICSNNHNMTLSQCISRRGGILNENEIVDDWVIASLGDLPPDPVWNSFNQPFAKAANTTIQLASDVSLPSYPVVLAVEGENSSVGQFGLAKNSVFLQRLKRAGLSRGAAFSYHAGSQSISHPRPGHIIFGGYDAAGLDGPFSNFTFSNTTKAGKRVCSLQVVVEKLVLSRPGLTDVELVSAGTPMTSCIEPLDHLFRLPNNTLDSFQRVTNWTDDPSLVSNQLYVVEPGLNYKSGFNGTLKFTIKNGPIVEIPNEEIAQALTALDQSGKRVLQNNVTVVNIFHQEAPEETAVLGQAFLSQLIMTINNDDETFQLAPATTGLEALNIVPFDSPGDPICSPSTTDRTYIGVIVIGCVLALLIAIIIIRKLRRIRLSKRQETKNPEELASELVIKNDLAEKDKCIVDEEAIPVEPIPSQKPIELHGGPRGSVAAELEPVSPISDRKFSGTTEFSNPQSNSEDWQDQIFPK